MKNQNLNFSKIIIMSIVMVNLFSACNTTIEPEVSDEKLSSSSVEITVSSSSSKSISLGGSTRVEGEIEKLLNPKPCLATFTKDHFVENYFGDTLFEVKAGESFMVGYGPALFGYTSLYKEDDDVDAKHQIIDFDIDGDLTKSLLHFSCNPDTDPSVYVNFKELDFYKDTKLSKKVCTLPVGTVLSNKETGYAVVNDGDPEKPAYEMYPTNTQSGCAGGQYVPAETFEIYGTYYTRAALGVYIINP